MNEEAIYDVAVVGGGQGGIYASYRFDRDGLSVVGIERGTDFGGVWHHNRYPGARIDAESVDYCFHFSEAIYDKACFPTRYADGEGLREYLLAVAEELDVRRLFRLGTAVCSAQWDAGDERWHLLTDQGERIGCRFLVMCTGNLSQPKPLQFPGLERFTGRWAQTCRWPAESVDLSGRRVGIVGTGASGTQVVPIAAEVADHVSVFQRHPHYAVPARNRPTDWKLRESIVANLSAERERLLTAPGVRPRGTESAGVLGGHTADEIGNCWSVSGNTAGMAWPMFLAIRQLIVP